MKMEKIKQQLEAEAKKTAAKLHDARVSLGYWTEEVRQLEAEVTRLHAAIKALGDQPSIPVSFQPPVVVVSGDSSIKTISPNEVEINGQKFVLEPGFEVVVNSQGEPCMVPVGTKPVEIEIPEIPQVEKKATSVPGSAGFEDPKDMF